MGGFFSALAGAGQQAGNMAVNLQQHRMQVWEQGINHMSNLISQAMQNTRDPGILAGLYDLQGDVAAHRPGKPFDKELQKFQELTQIHPTNVNLMRQVGLPVDPPPPPPNVPNPAPHGALASLIGAPVGDAFNPNASSASAQPPAQPSPDTSLIPAIGGAPAAAAATPPAPAPQPKPAAPAAAQPSGNPIQGGASIQIPPVSTAPATSGAGSISGLMDQAYGDNGGYPFVPPLVQKTAEPAIQAEVANRAELERQQQMAQFQLELGKKKLDTLQAAGIDVPDFMKAGILTGSNVMPMGMGSLMTPIRYEADAASLPPETLAQFGIDPKKTPKVTVLQDKMSGQISGVVGGFIPPKTATGADGTQFTYNPGTGHQIAPIQGAVSPSMMGTRTSESSAPTSEGGHVETKTVQKVPPVGGSGANGTRGSAPTSTQPLAPIRPTGASGGSTNPNSLQTRAKYWVDQLTQPNLTTSEQSGIWAKINGDKPLANEVRRSLEQSGTSVRAFNPQVAEQAQLANQVQSHLVRINSLVDQLEQSGDLGPIMGRWNEFRAGKVGDGNPAYAKLRVNLGLLETALGRVHGGARGGASPSMLQHFEHLMNADKMDAQTLRSTLGEVHDWLNTYANPATSTKDNTIPPVTGSQTDNDPAGIRQFIQQ